MKKYKYIVTGCLSILLIITGAITTFAHISNESSPPNQDNQVHVFTKKADNYSADSQAIDHDEHFGETKNFKESKIIARNYLLTKNRGDKLNICIQDYTGKQDVDSIKTTITSMIDVDFKVHKRWIKQGLDNFMIDVSSACSFEPILLQEGKNHVFFSGDLSSIRVVKEASPERIGIFIVDRSIIDKHFDGVNSRLTPEEFIIDDVQNEALEVTTSIYFSVDELKNPEFIQQQLKYVLGLDIIKY